MDVNLIWLLKRARVSFSGSRLHRGLDLLLQDACTGGGAKRSRYAPSC